MAKILANYIRKEDKEDGVYLTFKITDNMAKSEVESQEFGLTDLSFHKHYDKRTKSQNSYFWKLVGLISKKQDLKIEETVKLLLLDACVKYTIYSAPLVAEDKLKEQFKFVKLIAVDFEDKSKGIFQCFYGTSDMDKKEFSKLIETAERWCDTLEIPIID